MKWLQLQLFTSALFFLFFFSSALTQLSKSLQLSALELPTKKAWVLVLIFQPLFITFLLKLCVCVCAQCDLSVADLLENHPTPLFYDVFMDLGGGENRKLLPLPTLVYNQQYSGRFINQGAFLLFECVCSQCLRAVSTILHLNHDNECPVWLQ